MYTRRKGNTKPLILSGSSGSHSNFAPATVVCIFKPTSSPSIKMLGHFHYLTEVCVKRLKQSGQMLNSPDLPAR